jgi:hypothetical protein
MSGMVDALVDHLVGRDDDDYRVAEFALERRDPDPKPRVKTFDYYVHPEEVAAMSDLPAGTYILQEVKPGGQAGDVVWKEELDFEEDKVR